MVRVQGLVRYHLDQLHHASIFVNENMAVDHVLTGEVHEARTHPEPARDGFRASSPCACGIGLQLRGAGRHLCRIRALAGDVELRTCWYSEGIPPDVWRLRLLRGAWPEGRGVVRIHIARISLRCGRLAVGLEDLGDLEGVDVDMERVRLVIGLIHYRPLFGRVQKHGLVHLVWVKALSIDRRITRAENQCPPGKSGIVRNIFQEWWELRKIAFGLDEIHCRTHWIVGDLYGEQREGITR